MVSIPTLLIVCDSIINWLSRRGCRTRRHTQRARLEICGSKTRPFKTHWGLFHLQLHIGLSQPGPELLCAHVLHVNVDARVDVVEQVPARMIWIVVNHKVIAARPAPVSAERPVPQRDFEKEAAW